MRKKRKSTEYSSVSLPANILHKIDSIVDELGYWPSRSAFVREACLEKIDKYRKYSKDHRNGGSTFLELEFNGF